MIKENLPFSPNMKLKAGRYIFTFNRPEGEKFIEQIHVDNFPIERQFEYDGKISTLKVFSITNTSEKNIEIDAYITSPPVIVAAGIIAGLGLTGYSL
jgi:hypothetical protein